MKYKLVNLNTKEEAICDKVTVDKFDYYVSDEQATEGFYGYINFQGGDIKKIGKYFGDDWKKVIVTNNPNIDIPKVLPINHCECNLTLYPDQKEICKDICDNKYQETYIFTEQDIINFAEWAALNMSITPRKRTWYRFADKTDELAAYTTKEILQIWKEQQSKIVYYE